MSRPRSPAGSGGGWSTPRIGTFPPLEAIESGVLDLAALPGADPLSAAFIDVSGLFPAKLPERALLTLWNPESEEAVIFDPPPAELRTSAGTTTASVDLDAFGSVTRPTGRVPTTYSFSGTFYGARRYDTPIIFPDRFREPNAWRWLLEEFHRLQATRVRPLELHLEGWDIPPFTKPVDIASLEFSYRGGAGDLAYSISLTEHRHVQVGVEGADVEGALDAGEGAPPIPATYIVRANDMLSSIAAEFLGDARRWPEIADLNGLSDADVEFLHIGMELALPGGQPEGEAQGGGLAAYGALDAEEDEA